MASQPPDPNALPDSIVLGAFDGLHNTVAPERLGARDLAKAVNIDLDDSGQPRRRRGYVNVDNAEWHSIKSPIGGKAYGVRAGKLGIIRPDHSFFDLGIVVGAARVCYTEVNEEIYFSSASMSGIIGLNEFVRPWGATDGQGFWDSPVYSPTETLGEVGGRLLGDPMLATEVEAFHGRIYLAAGKIMWRTELYRLNYIDRTKGFYQFEHDITMVMGVDDGLYVGTTEGLYFLQEERILMREFKSLKLTKVCDCGVLRGSGVYVPQDLVRPGALQQPVPTGAVIVFYADDGVMLGLNGGEVYNLTHTRAALPTGVSAAGLFRQDQGANSYVVAVDSAGDPTSTARFGDFIDAEIIRAVDRLNTPSAIPSGFAAVTQSGQQVTQDGQPVYVAE